MSPRSSERLPAILGGRALLSSPLQIVRPLFPPLDELAAPLSKAMASGIVTNNGPHVQAFERRLSEYLGVPTLAFSSGQAALLAMLYAKNLRGREVIVPSFTFCATPHAACWAGATPVFVDVHPKTLTLDPAAVEKAITPNTGAILGTCSYGIACDYEALSAIGRNHNIAVLFDSAAAFGTRVNDKLVGGFGDAQIFSFHATKAFTTMEGGALCSHDAEFMKLAAAIRNFGQNPGDPACIAVGFNGKMMEICALIGMLQLERFGPQLARRQEVAHRYIEGLRSLKGITVFPPPAGQAPVWLYFPFLVDAEAAGLTRDEMALALEKENIFVRKYFSPPCHHMPVYAQHKISLPVTERTAYNVVALPVHNNQSDEEIEAILMAIHSIHAHAGDIRKSLAAR